MSVHRTRSFAVLAALLFATIVTAQHDTLWVRLLSGTGNGIDQVKHSTSDAAGNVYVLAQTAPDDSSLSIITAKYTSSGTLAWSHLFQPSGPVVPEAVAVDQSGNVYVVGTVINLPWDKIVVLKYTAAGGSAWVTYHSANDNVWASGLKVAPDGSIYVVGTQETADTEEDMLLVKYSPDGVEQWARMFDYQSEDDYGLDVVIDQQGYIYSVGSVLDWDNGNQYEMQVLKYSADGALVWSRALRGPGINDDSAEVAVIDEDNYLVVAGSSNPNLDNGGFGVAKFSPSGDTVWSRWFVTPGEDNHAVGVGTDSSGNVYVASNQDEDYLLVKYSAEGYALWRTHLETTAPDSLAGLIVMPGGESYISGSTGPNDGRKRLTTFKYSAAGDSLWAVNWSAPDTLGTWGSVLHLGGAGIVTGGWFTRHPNGARYPYSNGLLVSFDHSGSQAWTQSISGPGPDENMALDVVFDSSGNVIVAGYLDMTNHGQELVVAKYTSAGALLWQKTYNGMQAQDDGAVALGIGQTGDVYVTGYSEGPGTCKDYVTVKYNEAGTEQWVRRYDGPAHLDDLPSAIALDRTGNVAVTGRSHGGSSDWDYATVCYSPSGAQRWAARYNGTANAPDVATSVVTDSAGAVYVAGQAVETGLSVAGVATVIKYDDTGDTIWVLRVEGVNPRWKHFQDARVVLGPTGDLYLGGTGHGAYLCARLSPDGDTVWVRAADWERGSLATAVTVGESGTCVVTGCVWSTVPRDYALAAFDHSGVLKWMRTWDGNEARDDVVADIVAEGDRSVYVTGYGRNLGFTTDAVTVCYDSVGVEVWADSFDAGNYALDQGTAIACSREGRVCVAGNSGWYQQGRFRSDFFTAVYSPRIGIAELEYSLQSVADGICAWPNPFSRQTAFRSALGTLAKSEIRIMDPTGRVLRSLSSCSRSASEVRWDGRGDDGKPVPMGVYLVEITTRVGGALCARRASIKIVKSR